MRPTYKRTGSHYLPVIAHDNGHREVLYGPPLIDRSTAIKYAMLDIRDRLAKKLWQREHRVNVKAKS